MEKSEKFKNWCSGIQSIGTIAVLIAGAFWTVHTFGALRQKAIADAQLAQAHEQLFKEGALDFQIDAQEQQVQHEPGYYIAIKVGIKNVGNQDVLMCLEDPDDPGESNCGKDADNPCKATSERLPLGSPPHPGSALRPLRSPIQISRATLKSGSLVFKTDPETFVRPMYRDDCTEHEVEVSAIRIQPGQTEWYTAAAHVPKGGFYRITFFSYITRFERDKMATSDQNARPSPSSRPLPIHSRPYWSAKAFLAIGSTPTSKSATSKQQ